MTEIAVSHPLSRRESCAMKPMQRHASSSSATTTVSNRYGEVHTVVDLFNGRAGRTQFSTYRLYNADNSAVPIFDWPEVYDCTVSICVAIAKMMPLSTVRKGFLCDGEKTTLPITIPVWRAGSSTASSPIYLFDIRSSKRAACCPVSAATI